MSFDDAARIYKRYVEPFIAIFVLLGLIYACFMLKENYQAKRNIAEECGWNDGDVRCWCEKSQVIAAENRIHGELGEVIINVSLDE